MSRNFGQPAATPKLTDDDSLDLLKDRGKRVNEREETKRERERNALKTRRLKKKRKMSGLT